MGLRRLRRVHVAYLQVGFACLDRCTALALACRIAFALDCRIGAVCPGKGPCRGKRAGRNVARAGVPRNVMTLFTERSPEQLRTLDSHDEHGLVTSAAGSPCTTALPKLTAGRGNSGTPDEPRNGTWRQLQQGRSLKDGAQGRSLRFESVNRPAVQNM